MDSNSNIIKILSFIYLFYKKSNILNRDSMKMKPFNKHWKQAMEKEDQWV